MLPVHPIFIQSIKDIYETAISRYKNPIQFVEFIPDESGGVCHPRFKDNKKNATVLVEAIKRFN